MKPSSQIDNRRRRMFRVKHSKSARLIRLESRAYRHQNARAEFLAELNTTNPTGGNNNP